MVSSATVRGGAGWLKRNVKDLEHSEDEQEEGEEEHNIQDGGLLCKGSPRKRFPSRARASR